MIFIESKISWQDHAMILISWGAEGIHTLQLLSSILNQDTGSVHHIWKNSLGICKREREHAVSEKLLFKIPIV